MNANEKNGRAAKIEQLLDWPTSVAEAGWRAVADADKVFVEYYERDKPESEVEGEDFAAVYGTRNDENARLMAAAPSMGLSCHPQSFINTPAATGMPIVL